jgi:membrane dipeptidase
MLALGRYRLHAQGRREYSARAIELVEGSLVLDLLGQLTLDFEHEARWLGHPETYPVTEWERWRASGINAMHIGIGLGQRDAYQNALQFFGAWNAFVAEHDTHCLRIDSPADLERLTRDERIGFILGLQDSEHFRGVDDVDLFHGLGQRISQLTYNSRNRLGNGSTERVDGGISDFGAAVIARMNDVGMAVDVSHCGDRTTLDAFELSGRPVLITHSNCRALAPGHPRCKSDEAIVAMARTGGVMGITGVRNFVTHEEPTTIEHYLDHFDHVRDLVGAEHLGIGSDIDLDGYDDMPADQYAQLKAGYKDDYAFRDKIDIDEIAHPRRMYDIAEGLVRRGYADAEIEGILGGNFRRVLGNLWTPLSPATP